MSAQKKKTVQFVEAVDEIEESAPAVVETRSRSKPRATVTMVEAVFSTAQACFAAYERSIGKGRGRGEVLILKTERPYLRQAAYMADLRERVFEAASDEERLALFQGAVRYFNRAARGTIKQLERRRENEEFDALAIVVNLVDPGADVSGWNGRPRSSEFFGLRERAEAREVETKAQPKMPFYPDKNTVPIMPGVLIDGLPKHHPMQPTARPKKRTVGLVSVGQPQPKPPMTGADNVEEINSHGQRTLRDAFGTVQDPRVPNGALGWR
jgi:hypothetical protein